MKPRGHEEDNDRLEFPPDRVAYFENLAQKVLDSQGGSREFYDLVKRRPKFYMMAAGNSIQATNWMK